MNGEIYYLLIGLRSMDVIGLLRTDCGFSDHLEEMEMCCLKRWTHHQKLTCDWLPQAVEDDLLTSRANSTQHVLQYRYSCN